MSLLYLDASAAVKLVCDEDESLALRRALGDSRLVTSVITRVETHRAAFRRGAPRHEQVAAMLDTVTQIDLGADVVRVAGRLEPAGVRSLDAIHVATALGLGAELTALVTYDQRMRDAAVARGLEVLSPA